MLRTLCSPPCSPRRRQRLAQTAPAKKGAAKTKKPPGGDHPARTWTRRASRNDSRPRAGGNDGGGKLHLCAKPPRRQRDSGPSAVVDQEEFRRQVMEEVRREAAEAEDEVKQETAWVEQGLASAMQDSEAVDSLKQTRGTCSARTGTCACAASSLQMASREAPIRPAFQRFPGPISGRRQQEPVDVEKLPLPTSSDAGGPRRPVHLLQADISTTSAREQPGTTRSWPLHPHLAAVDAAPRRHGR